MTGAEFYNQSFKQIFRFFYYKVSDVPISEDLASETYMAFFDKYSHLLANTDDSAIKLLYGIAKNLWKKYLQKQKNSFIPVPLFFARFENLGDFEILDKLENSETLNQSNSLELQKQVNLELIKQTLKSLNPKLQTVIELRFQKGLTRSETAKLMGLSEDIIHTYQKRAIKYLKQKLNPTPTVPQLV
jgi:RNA polymerase sigma-70 factor, ECF subfamily